MIRIIGGDCHSVLATLDAGSVQCCVTSPPYYGLRQYLPEGHPDMALQIGTESSPDEYVAEMVGVFRHVKRVLRDDGTLWLNIGSSYSMGSMADHRKVIDRLIKQYSVFVTRSGSVAVSSNSVSIPAEDKLAPNGILPSLLASERGVIKNGHQDLGKVIDLFATPSDGCLSLASGGMLADIAASDFLADVVDDSAVIVANSNPKRQPEFGITRVCRAGSRVHNKGSFAVNEACEPCAETNVRWHAVWNTFSAHARAKGIPDVNFMDEAVALSHCLNRVAGLVGDFSVTKASDKHLTLSSVAGGVSIRISDVGHLRFVSSDGRVIPYDYIWEQALQETRRNRTKQDLRIPDRLCTALQEDGWICRSTIIWHKPNPMPESVKDRPTNAHEHVFLLTKSERYFYDADSVREPHETAERTGERRSYKPGSASTMNGGDHQAMTGSFAGLPLNPAGRNARNVWTIASQPFSGAHFATMPPDLAERCIKAGSRLGDTILDPFSGAGTTALVADRLGRSAIGIELNPEYAEMARNRITGDCPMFASVA